MQDDTLPANDTVPGWLLQLTFAVQYNPNCPKPWLVRLPSFRAGGLDNLSYCGPLELRTKDALGFGATCEEAALKAKAIVDAQRQTFHDELAAARAARESRQAA